MTFQIDGERFEAHLTKMLTDLRAASTERHQMDDERDEDGTVVHEDHSALRIDGGVASLQLVLQALRNFEVAPRRSRKPVAEVAPETSTKVRRHDPGTSWEAATKQTPEKSQRLYKAIHRILSATGAKTDDELIGFMEAQHFSHTPSGVRSRRRELTDAGWVRDSGTKRLSNAGGPSIVWEAVREDA